MAYYRRRDYDRDYYGDRYGRGREDEGLLDRAQQEVRSWFDDDDRGRYGRERYDRDDRWYGGRGDTVYGRYGGRDYSYEGGGGNYFDRRDDAGRYPMSGYGRGDFGGRYGGREESYGGPYGFGGGYDRDYDRDFARGRGGVYGSGRAGAGRYDYGEDRRRGGGDRGWWERTRDEVSSWFGDEEAERRRRQDEMRGDYGGSAGHRGRGPKNYRRSDERIREDVSDRLSDNDWLDASEVDVRVEGGEVTLDGTVESRYAKRLAEDLAESCSGVSHVQNNLRVGRHDYRPASTDATAAGKGTTTGTTRAGDAATAAGRSAAAGTTSGTAGGNVGRARGAATS